ncbi:hypothetical protein BDZ94DRAFT_1267822 [Collybia nuda]|uniref:Uncharacterized protein n=1 Tax=Collybia nuda TaxID=64659 RepID=A0A9P5XZS3_9AGAR|nr:hypothetical protein BDZ94DRAFT_1267822 [Collybia nuda]
MTITDVLSTYMLWTVHSKRNKRRRIKQKVRLISLISPFLEATIAALFNTSFRITLILGEYQEILTKQKNKFGKFWMKSCAKKAIYNGLILPLLF